MQRLLEETFIFDQSSDQIVYEPQLKWQTIQNQLNNIISKSNSIDYKFDKYTQSSKTQRFRKNYTSLTTKNKQNNSHSIQHSPPNKTNKFNRWTEQVNNQKLKYSQYSLYPNSKTMKTENKKNQKSKLSHHLQFELVNEKQQSTISDSQQNLKKQKYLTQQHKKYQYQQKRQNSSLSRKNIGYSNIRNRLIKKQSIERRKQQNILKLNKKQLIIQTNQDHIQPKIDHIEPKNTYIQTKKKPKEARFQLKYQFESLGNILSSQKIHQNNYSKRNSIQKGSSKNNINQIRRKSIENYNQEKNNQLNQDTNQIEKKNLLKSNQTNKSSQNKVGKCFLRWKQTSNQSKIKQNIELSLKNNKLPMQTNKLNHNQLRNSLNQSIPHKIMLNPITNQKLTQIQQSQILDQTYEQTKIDSPLDINHKDNQFSNYKKQIQDLKTFVFVKNYKDVNVPPDIKIKRHKSQTINGQSVILPQIKNIKSKGNQTNRSIHSLSKRQSLIKINRKNIVQRSKSLSHNPNNQQIKLNQNKIQQINLIIKKQRIISKGSSKQNKKGKNFAQSIFKQQNKKQSNFTEVKKVALSSLLNRQSFLYKQMIQKGEQLKKQKSKTFFSSSIQQLRNCNKENKNKIGQQNTNKTQRHRNYETQSKGCLTQIKLSCTSLNQNRSVGIKLKKNLDVQQNISLLKLSLNKNKNKLVIVKR